MTELVRGIRVEFVAELITTCAVLHLAGPDAMDDGRTIVGHCPACHRAVCDDGSDPDGPVTPNDSPVWTCPTNLSEGNPHHADAMVSEALQDREEIYSNCGTDFGFSCYEDMPLHNACYGNGAITY